MRVEKLKLCVPVCWLFALLAGANFDALLIQDYNQQGGAKFDGLEDTDPGFITASFTPLTEIIPSTTKIVVGEPASCTAGTGLSDPSTIVKDIQSGNVLPSAQYGGIMTWSLNNDADQNWSFADDVNSVVTKLAKTNVSRAVLVVLCLNSKARVSILNWGETNIPSNPKPPTL